jgi:MerR family transcriptional regulator, light-induced transcriptional regulator
MHPFYTEFIGYLDQEDKEKSVRWILGKIQDNSIEVVTLYNQILTPALNVAFCKSDQKEICIWEEHIRTSIIRTIIECCYPYVIQERDEKYHSAHKGKTLVVCPPGELHEIGARMIADFFILCGFRVVFVGANTPQDDIINAIKYEKPEFVAISITNYFNLVETRTMIQRISDLKSSLTFKVILGGQACQGNPAACRQFNPDLILHSFEDIKRLSEGDINAAV